MIYAKLDTARLCDVGADYYYAASCRACRHHSRLCLVKLREHLGGDFPLVDLRWRLRCGRCGAKRCIITFLTPGQKLGNLVQLFVKEEEGRDY
jgi:hypothetical protein